MSISINILISNNTRYIAYRPSTKQTKYPPIPLCVSAVQPSKELSLTLDITEEIAVVSYEPDDEVKEKKNITLTTEVIPFYLEKLDATAAENGGHLALGKVCMIFYVRLL